jgi:hypothetical protein
VLHAPGLRADVVAEGVGTPTKIVPTICSIAYGRGGKGAAYLKRFHPELAADCARDLRALRVEIAKTLTELDGELAALSG